MKSLFTAIEEGLVYITKPADFVPTLTRFFGLDWSSYDSIEYWDAEGRRLGKLTEPECGISLSMLKKAISRRGFSAEILFDHNNRHNPEDDFAWYETKRYKPVYKIDNAYYLCAFRDHTGELVFTKLDYWLDYPNL